MEDELMAGPANAAIAPQVPADSLEDKLKNLQKRLTDLYQCYNQLDVEGTNPPDPRRADYNPLPYIRSILTAAQQTLQDFTKRHKNLQPCEIQDHIKYINTQLEIVLTQDTDDANGANQIDVLINQTSATASRRIEHIRACNQIIDALHTRLRTYINQGIDDETQAPLDGSDRNLAREIDAFFLSTRARLAATHRSLAKAVEDLRTFEKEVKEIQQNLARIQLSVGITEELTQSGKAPQQRAPMANLLKHVRSYVETMSPTQIAPDRVRQELIRTQESLGKVLAQLDKSAQCFRDVKTIEATALQNLKTLCAILDTGGNRQFQIYNQEKIERSLVFDLARSNLLEYAVRQLLPLLKNLRDGNTRDGSTIDFLPHPSFANLASMAEYFLTHMYPETAYAQEHQDVPQDAGLQPIQGRTPHYPLAGRILYSMQEWLTPKPVGHHQPIFPDLRQTIDQFAPELQGILDGGNRQTPGIQPGEQQTFDDRYTSWLINTHNPQYLLYDIAARTRFNTGRFTYLLRLFIHRAEQAVGGKYKKKEPAQDLTPMLEELERRDAQARQEYEQEKARLDSQTRGPGEEVPQLPTHLLLPKHCPQPDPGVPGQVRQPGQETFEKKLKNGKTGLPDPVEHKQMEQPGERYTSLMDLAAYDYNLLEHSWLYLHIPSWSIRCFENILRTADPMGLPPAPQQEANAADEPFVSEGPISFIWNGLKKLSNWSVQGLTSLTAKSARTCYEHIKQVAECVTRPFTRVITNFLRNTPCQQLQHWFTGYIDKLKELNLKKHAAQKFRSALMEWKATKTFVQIVEEKIREKQPLSDRITAIQKLARHPLMGELVRKGLATAAHHAPTIRALAKKYGQIQRIDPIIPLSPDGEQIEAESTIKDARLRQDLGSFIGGWSSAKQPGPRVSTRRLGSLS
jgi:hypothetical protein